MGQLPTGGGAGKKLTPHALLHNAHGKGDLRGGGAWQALAQREQLHEHLAAHPVQAVHECLQAGQHRWNAC